jgi:hypothetical protein
VCVEGKRKVLLLTVRKKKEKKEMLIKTVTTQDNLISRDYETITFLAEYFIS